jgi:CHAT domain-containing protein/Tfp pilus assembly protein PilF
MLKIFIYIFFCLFLSSHCYSQDGNYDVWKKNFERGEELLEFDKPKDALTYFEQASQEAAYLFTNKDKELGDTYFKLGLAYKNVKNYQKSLIFYEKAIDNAIARDDDNAYIERLVTKAEVYRLSLDYDASIETLKKSLQIIEKSSGRDDRQYSTTLIKLATVYRVDGDYKSAFATINEALQLIERNVGRDDSDYSDAVTILTHIYKDTADYDTAITLQEQQLKKIDDDNKDTESYAMQIYALSTLYHKVGEYQKELPLLIQVTEIKGGIYKEHPAINNQFAQAYERTGDYEKALSHTLRSLDNTDVSDEDYGTRIQNLAYIYTEMGEFEKALDAYEKALFAMEKTKGKESDKYGKLLNNIGKLQYKLGNYEKAKVLFSEALDILMNHFSVEHADYGYYLRDYATTLMALGQNDKAIELMISNLEIAEKNLNTENESYYNQQYELANAYNSLGRFEEALPLLQSTTKNLKLKLGPNHADYGKLMKSLGDAYVGVGNWKQAYLSMKLANKVNYKELEKIFKFRSENEKKSFLNVISKNFDHLQSVALDQHKNNENWNNLNLNNQLMLKGLLLNNSKNVLTQLSTLNDAAVDETIGNYKSLKQQLAKTMSISSADRTVDIDSLKNVINIEEANLVKLHSTNFNDTLNLNINWKHLQSKLPKRAVGIEFSHFRKTINGKPSDSLIYVAYVYNSKSEFPTMVRLFEEGRLKKLIKKSKPNQLYASTELFQLICSPLEAELKMMKTIYYSPSGLLNLIQFAAIKNSDGNIIGKEYDLVQLSSTSVLAEQPTEPKAKQTLFIGGIDYDFKIGASADTTRTSSGDTKFSNNKKIRGSRGESWDYLPGTVTEINSLKQILDDNGKSFNVLTKRDATETNFKKLSGNSPNVLHIATHGYFYEYLNRDISQAYNLSTEDQYRLAEDPLMRSGLIFAGANYTWKNGSNPNEDDGILTGMEISNLDLSNTEMVVLSACNTGLGDIDGSEGVYGLQRAFKMAGVDIIVMSLWQVPDSETAEFMNLFYGYWMQGAKVRQAFNKAQRTMQKKYADEPLKWAAFVLFE